MSKGMGVITIGLVDVELIEGGGSSSESVSFTRCHQHDSIPFSITLHISARASSVQMSHCV